jgi:spermidine synthase
MQKIRASLSRLFLKKPSTIEALRIKKLEQLQKKHQGKPFVFDEGNLRFMYFSQKSVQSAMKINAPDELLCGYTSAMLAFLLANPAPQHILMIGLGGGSLVKFCHRHLPESRITVLEIDADVIALREQFMIPADDDRLQIIHADALTYLKQNAMQVDVILLDGFDINGLVDELNTANFYVACDKALKPHGILVANMWGKRKQLVSLLTALRTQFEQRVWWCRSLDSYNLLVFSFKAQAEIFTDSMSAKAQVLDQKFALKFTELSAQMRSLHIPSSSKFNAKEDYEIKELARLTTEMAELMVTDETLVSSDVEWSEIHQ